MKITLILLLLFTILLLYSFRHTLKRFDKFECFIFFLFTSFLCQHINFKIFSAFERLSVQEGITPKFISYIHFGLILPCILLWVLYQYRLSKLLVDKCLYSLIWISFDLFSKKLYVIANVLETDTRSWYPVIDLCVSIIVLLFSLLFMKTFSSILKKERASVE